MFLCCNTAIWKQEEELKGDFFAQNTEVTQPGPIAPWYQVSLCLIVVLYILIQQLRKLHWRPTLTIPERTLSAMSYCEGRFDNFPRVLFLVFMTVLDLFARCSAALRAQSECNRHGRRRRGRHDDPAGGLRIQPLQRHMGHQGRRLLDVSTIDMVTVNVYELFAYFSQSYCVDDAYWIYIRCIEQ